MQKLELAVLGRERGPEVSSVSSWEALMGTSKSGGLEPGLWLSAGAGKGRGKRTRRRLRKAVSNMGRSLGVAGDITGKGGERRSGSSQQGWNGGRKGWEDQEMRSEK